MEKEPIAAEKQSPSPGLIKTTAIFLIVRECLTLLYAYVTKSNAEYGLNQPSEKFEARVSMILAWGTGMLICSIIYLVDRKIASLGLLILAFLAEVVYQIYDGFFEFFYFISTPLVLVLLVILFFKTDKPK